MRIGACAALALSGLLGCTPPADPNAPMQWLHVIVDRLPQCAYGIGFEQPVRVDLRWDDEVVATAYSAGLSTDLESLRVALHVPEAPPGRYTVHIGQCPSLRDDPEASVRCEPVHWVERTTVRLQPAGIEQPIVVHPGRMRMRCLDGQTAYFP